MPTKEQIKEINSKRKPTKAFSEEQMQEASKKTIPIILFRKLISILNSK